MKYKVGNLVKIKTWERMEKEYGLTELGEIGCYHPHFIKNMEKSIRETDRIVKILEVHNKYYKVENFGWNWSDDMIEDPAKQEIFKPINSRFEILDIR